MSPVAATIVSTVLSVLVAQNAPAADPPATGSNTSGLVQTGFIERGSAAVSGAISRPQAERPTRNLTRNVLRSDALRDRAHSAAGRASSVIRQRGGYSDSDGSTSGAVAAQSATTVNQRLDLRIPDVTTILTPEQIQRILSKTFDANLEEVEVEGQRTRIIPNTPDIPGGIAAPFWALAHPTQAWRIFLPLAPDQAQKVGNERFDITDPNLPPMLPPQM